MYKIFLIGLLTLSFNVFAADCKITKEDIDGEDLAGIVGKEIKQLSSTNCEQFKKIEKFSACSCPTSSDSNPSGNQESVTHCNTDRNETNYEFDATSKKVKPVKAKQE